MWNLNRISCNFPSGTTFSRRASYEEIFSTYSVIAPQGHFRRAADMEYGIPGCTVLILRGSVGKWLGQCDIRSGSRIRGRAGNGAGGHDSVEKDRGTDPQHGQIAATSTGQTRLVATPGAMLIFLLESSWSLRAHRVPSRSPVLPCGAPCRARLDLVMVCSDWSKYRVYLLWLVWCSLLPP